MAGTGPPAAAAGGGGRPAGPPRAVAQLVQLTAQAKRLQEPLAGVLKTVQHIENEFDQRDAKLAADRAEMERQHESKEEQLKQWAAYEQGKLDGQHKQLELEERAFKERMRWDRDMLGTEKEAFEYRRAEGAKIAHRQEPVTVEVGGDKFRTELSTLTKCQNSIFPDLVEAVKRKQESDRDGKMKRDPYIFIDRDPRHFRFILNYLRQGEQVMRGGALKKYDKDDLQDVLFEVQYYRLTDLERLLRRKVSSLKKHRDFKSLVDGADYFQKIPAPSNQRQPPQNAYEYTTVRDISLKGENLRGIEFKKVVFDHTISFQDCILVEARFVQCLFRGAVNLQNADLFRAKFDHCEGIDFVRRFFKDKANTNEVEFVPPLVDDDS